MESRAAQPELPIDAAWRAALGLADDEGLRLCDLGPRTVLLERVCTGADEWKAWPFAPTLAADVAGFAVQDAFAWLERTGKSGLLHLAQRHPYELIAARVVGRSLDRLGAAIRGGLLTPCGPYARVGGDSGARTRGGAARALAGLPLPEAVPSDE